MPIKLDPQMTDIRELADKDLKAAILNIISNSRKMV